MRLVLVLLVVVGFVAFAASLPVITDDPKSEEIETPVVFDDAQEDLPEIRHKRKADSSDSTSEESDEVKKTKPLVAAVAQPAAQDVSAVAAATNVEDGKVGPVAVRRKRSVETPAFFDNAQEDLTEIRHKRNADSSDSTSEESDEEKKTKPLVAAVAQPAAQEVGVVVDATNIEGGKAGPVAVRRKRSTVQLSENILEANKKDAECKNNDSNSNSEEQQPEYLSFKTNSEENQAADSTSNSKSEEVDE